MSGLTAASTFSSLAKSRHRALSINRLLGSSLFARGLFEGFNVNIEATVKFVQIVGIVCLYVFDNRSSVAYIVTIR